MAEGPDSATHLTSAAQGLFNVPSSSCTAVFSRLGRTFLLHFNMDEGMLLGEDMQLSDEILLEL